MPFPQRNDRPGLGGPGNYRINNRIRAKQVRVIQGEQQLGVMLLQDALKQADEAGLDLVEVNPLATPYPVCKIMDYGKFKYDTKKQAAESRKKQVVMDIKEVKLRPKSGEHDVEFKVRHIHDFLEDGMKVKVTIMFRGREITHAEIGRDILRKVSEQVKTLGQIEQMPKIEGKNMFMVLSPIRKGQAKPVGAPVAPRPVGAPPSAARAPAASAARRTAAAPEIEVKQKRPATPAPQGAKAPEET